jgi:hypothetical protein
MSYRTMLDALHIQFAAVPGLVVMTGMPLAVTTSTPMLYSELQGFTREATGTTFRITYRTRHRLCVLTQDPQAAEEVVVDFVNSLPAALTALPRRGLVESGDMQITRGDAGWVDLAGITYRVVDFVSEMVEIARLGGSI